MFLAFPFYIFLGSIDHVVEDAKELKDIAKNINKEIKEGFHKIQGKIISFACLMMFIK